MNMKPKNKRVLSFLSFAMFIALFFQRDCIPDDYNCDPDPLRGGGSCSICEWDWNTSKFIGNSFGLYVLMEIGVMIDNKYPEGREEREKREKEEERRKLEKELLESMT